jgi:hypothetical protein
MDLYEIGKRVALRAALRVALLALALVGRELPLSGEEREGLAARARAALLGPGAPA